MFSILWIFCTFVYKTSKLYFVFLRGYFSLNSNKILMVHLRLLQSIVFSCVENDALYIIDQTEIPEGFSNERIRDGFITAHAGI